MSTPQDPSERAALELVEQIAQFDREELEFGQIPREWRDADGNNSELSEEQQQLLDELMAPMSEERSASILDAVMAQSEAERVAAGGADEPRVQTDAEPEPASAPVSLAEHRSRSPWVLPAITSAAIATAAAVALWWWAPTDPDPASFEPIAAYRPEVSALVLGANPSPPSGRVYGPGDEFVLSMVPSEPREPSPPARLLAVPEGGGHPVTIDTSPTIGSDGVIEFRHELTAVLEAGAWRLHVELGPQAHCARAPSTCFQADFNVVIVDH